MDAKEYIRQYEKYDRIARRCLEEYKVEAAIINSIIKSRKMLGCHAVKDGYDSRIASIIQSTKSLNDRAAAAIKKRDAIIKRHNKLMH